MSFNSIEFIIFLFTVVLTYFSLPSRYRRLFLLVASYVFYMSWNPYYGLILLSVSLMSYGAGRLLETESPRAPFFLWAGITGHLLIMFVFKYFSFFAANMKWLFGSLRVPFQSPTLEILLPVGISFYVFQSMSYLIDVYRRQIAAERNLGSHMLYISFFPQLVAGPIERAADLSPQLKKDHDFDPERVKGGVALIGAGLFKKVIIADTLSMLVSAMFQRPQAYGGLSLYLGAIMARYMIYCDIGGYTDIALGCGKIFGIKLSRNFARPFAARNISEYWQRWHMTLSGWFRDYVFYSLATSPLARMGLPAIIFMTFLLLGLWHGASWNFILFGCTHGIMMLVYQAMRSRGIRIPVGPIVRTLFTFFVLVSLPTVFAVAKDTGDSVYVFRQIFGFIADPARWLDVRWLFEGRNAIYSVCSIGLIGGLELIQKMDEREPVLQRIQRWSIVSRVGLYVAISVAVVLSVILVRFRYTNAEFIYFQF